MIADSVTGKKGRGRPEVQFTYEVESMAYGLVLQGVPYAVIARALNVSVNTLKKHLGATLRDAKSKCIATVSAALYRAALLAEVQPHGVSAAKFLLATQAGWIEKQGVELSGGGGGPVVVNVSFEDAALDGPEE